MSTDNTYEGSQDGSLALDYETGRAFEKLTASLLALTVSGALIASSLSAGFWLAANAEKDGPVQRTLFSITQRSVRSYANKITKHPEKSIEGGAGGTVRSCITSLFCSDVTVITAPTKTTCGEFDFTERVGLDGIPKRVAICPPGVR